MPKILVTESLGNSTRQFFLFVFSDESPTVFDRNIISNELHKEWCAFLK